MLHLLNSNRTNFLMLPVRHKPNTAFSGWNSEVKLFMSNVTKMYLYAVNVMVIKMAVSVEYWSTLT